MDAYRLAHDPNELPPEGWRVITRNHMAIRDLAEKLSLRVSIDHLEGKDDILWFSYTRGGVVQTKQLPTALRLERLAEALDIMEKAAVARRMGSCPGSGILR
ncbi:hypothetical protein MSAN_02485700 [Mycena sanguinolenta]|uniref:Uncharacterized protein n=1 Tax=Mycena sanguinolenta TaxID=230812 RepID=A0A8H6TZF2_9AGAR|nr:hypothetical protein MSAN_02485700 [Mycena sanguinolenta]